MAEEKYQTDYSTLPQPYDNFLVRASSGTSVVSGGGTSDVAGESSASSSVSEGSKDASKESGSTNIISGDEFENIWLNSWIKSKNFLPHARGFYLDARTGYLEAANAYIVGNITAESGNIGGFEIGASYIRDAANSFGLSSTVTAGDDVRFWAGATMVNMAAAPFRVTEAGVLTATSGTIGGCVLSASSIGSTNFVSGLLGSGWNISSTGAAEFQDCTIRGIIRTSVFEKAVISSVGGYFLVAPSDVLGADMTALDASTLTTTGVTFPNNSVLRMKDGVSDEYFLVVSSVGFVHTVTRDLAASYGANTNPIWKKGTACVSLGVGTGTKTGFIMMDTASANSPFIDIYGRNSNTYSDYTLHGRFGWLKGITDADVGLATTDAWGLYTDNAYIKGAIVANTGYIGGTTGWVIAAGYIKLDTGVELTSAGLAPLDYPFYAGAQYANRATAPFRVSNAGVLNATGATITGTVNATAGKFGTATNYWSVGSTGLTAVSASTDVIINYNKTDFGQDSTAGFILGYDYSATKAKFEIGASASVLLKYDGTDLSLTGGTITGGTIQTATSGKRIRLVASSVTTPTQAANSIALVNAHDDIIVGFGDETPQVAKFLSYHDDNPTYVCLIQAVDESVNFNFNTLLRIDSLRSGCTGTMLDITSGSETSGIFLSQSSTQCHTAFYCSTQTTGVYHCIEAYLGSGSNIGATGNLFYGDYYGANNIIKVRSLWASDSNTGWGISITQDGTITLSGHTFKRIALMGSMAIYTGNYSPDGLLDVSTKGGSAGSICSVGDGNVYRNTDGTTGWTAM